MKYDLLASVGEDASPLAIAAKRVLRTALDEVQTHPCDQGDDLVAAKSLSPEQTGLLEALIADYPPPARPGPDRIGTLTNE